MTPTLILDHASARLEPKLDCVMVFHLNDRRRDHFKFLYHLPTRSWSPAKTVSAGNVFLKHHYQHRHTSGGSNPRYVIHVEVINALFVHATLGLRTAKSHITPAGQGNDSYFRLL